MEVLGAVMEVEEEPVLLEKYGGAGCSHGSGGRTRLVFLFCIYIC